MQIAFCLQQRVCFRQTPLQYSLADTAILLVQLVKIHLGIASCHFRNKTFITLLLLIQTIKKLLFLMKTNIHSLNLVLLFL